MKAGAEVVRMGVVGLGNIGARHVATLLGDATPRIQLTAVAARGGAPEGLGLPAHVERFANHRELIGSGLVDAVLVATPTHSHVEAGEAVLDAGLHLLMEKPLAVSAGAARALVQRASPQSVFAVMLNQRFDPAYVRMHELIRQGALGELRRIHWTMTHWYRPDVYFRVSDWRGTWRGEGGGLLLNQSVHNLDVLQWLTGMPARLQARAGFGKHHSIDVEDEVSAWLEYDNGATGMVVASTGEAPGINQLDIVGDRGTLRYDGRRLVLHTSQEAVSEHCRSTLDLFGMPEFASSEEEIESGIDQHARLLDNFASAILDGTPLLTPAVEGVRSLELANAMLLSAWDETPVGLPLDVERYESQLRIRMHDTGFRQAEALDVNVDIEQSFR